MFFSCLLLALFNSTTARYYFGDSSLQDLQALCVSLKSNETTTKLMLFLIDNLLLLETQQTTVTQVQPMQRFMQQVECPFVPYRNLNRTQLTTLLNSQPQLQYKEWILLFDFTSSISTQAQFLQALYSLNSFYQHCLNCLPLLGLFNLPTSQMAAWSSGVITTLRSDFRMVLVSNAAAAKTATFHINPILFGCKPVNGILVPRTTEQFNQMKVPPKYCDLKQAMLTVSFNNVLPFCDIKQTKSGHTVIEFAIETEILKELEKKYHFQTTFRNANGSWGIVDENGSWTGVVGHVLNGASAIAQSQYSQQVTTRFPIANLQTSHLAMCSVSRTWARMQVLTYSYNLFIDELTFMSKSPDIRARDWLVLRPFSLLVWTCILASFALISVLLWCMIQRKQAANAPLICAILLELFAINMGKTTTLGSTLTSARLLYAIWILAALILSHSYSGCFYSILAVPEHEPPIDTLEDIARIARTDNGQLITIAQSSYLSQFLSAPSLDDNIFHLIGQHMNRTAKKMPQDEGEATQAIEQQPATTVLISTRINLAFLRNVYARTPLHIAREMMAIDSVHFIFPKKSPLEVPFSLIIKRMYQNGLVEKLLRTTFARQHRQKHPSAHLGGSPTTSTVLANKDLRSVYLLWLLGIVLSTGSFLGRLLINLF